MARHKRPRWNRLAPWQGEDLVAWEGDGDTPGVVWRPADEPRELTLTFRAFSRGRSAAHAVFHTQTGGEVIVHLEQLAELIRGGRFGSDGVVHGWWVVRKHGQNFTLAPSTPPQPAA